MSELNYAGEHGGLLSLAFAAGCTATTAFWALIARFVWNTFLAKRTQELEAEIGRLRQEMNDRENECDRQLTAQAARLHVLESMVLVRPSLAGAE